MANYKKMYHKLYNRITDVIVELQQIQQKTEEMYEKEQDFNLTMFNVENQEGKDQ